MRTRMCLFGQFESGPGLRARPRIKVPFWASRRPPGKARGARIPGVCKRRATQPGGMHRRSEWYLYSWTGPYSPCSRTPEGRTPTLAETELCRPTPRAIPLGMGSRLPLAVEANRTAGFAWRFPGGGADPRGRQIQSIFTRRRNCWFSLQMNSMGSSSGDARWLMRTVNGLV